MRRIVQAAMIVCATVLLVVPAHALPRSFDPRPRGEQTQYFQRILFELGLKPLFSYTDLAGDETSKVLIAIGQNVGLETRIPGGVRQFLEQGGSVLIASDIKLPDQLSKEIGVVIDGSFAGGWPFDS